MSDYWCCKEEFGKHEKTCENHKDNKIKKIREFAYNAPLKSVIGWDARPDLITLLSHIDNQQKQIADTKEEKEIWRVLAGERGLQIEEMQATIKSLDIELLADVTLSSWAVEHLKEIDNLREQIAELKWEIKNSQDHQRLELAAKDEECSKRIAELDEDVQRSDGAWNTLANVNDSCRIRGADVSQPTDERVIQLFQKYEKRISELETYNGIMAKQAVNGRALKEK